MTALSPIRTFTVQFGSDFRGFYTGLGLGLDNGSYLVDREKFVLLRDVEPQSLVQGAYLLYHLHVSLLVGLDLVL